MHHLTHKGFTEFMTRNFDLWIIVEGASKNGGSTSWCRSVKNTHTSKDGTLEYLRQVEKENKNVMVYSQSTHYASKDEQFNRGVSMLKTKTRNCFLWQVDCDEHWNIEDIHAAERKLWRSPEKVASFQFNHYVKKDIIASGVWGSGRVNRLWKWRGQMFKTHEPAVMIAQGSALELPQKFEHYSMVFEQDVKHKSRTYRGHELVYQNWLRLDSAKFPCHVSMLFGKNNPVGRSDSYLYKINQSCVNVPNQEAEKVAARITC